MVINQWREHNINIREIEFKCGLKIVSEVSFPHASNELTEVKAFLNDEISEYIIKISRRTDSDLYREYQVLSAMNGISVPKVIEHGIAGDKEYLVVEKVPGKKMSMIHKDSKLALHHLELFGESLAKIHKLDITEFESPKRKFHDYLHYDDFVNEVVNPWLKENKPVTYERCFCHGDHHYANVLFDDSDMYYVLDWELSGTGIKEFDIAWARVLRPGQEFFKTIEEEEAFIKGYNKFSNFNYSNYLWFKVLISSHFYRIGLENNQPEYGKHLREDINRIIRGT